MQSSFSPVSLCAAVILVAIVIVVATCYLREKMREK